MSYICLLKKTFNLFTCVHRISALLVHLGSFALLTQLQPTNQFDDEVSMRMTTIYSKLYMKKALEKHWRRRQRK